MFKDAFSASSFRICFLRSAALLANPLDMMRSFFKSVFAVFSCGVGFSLSGETIAVTSSIDCDGAVDIGIILSDLECVFAILAGDVDCETMCSKESFFF
jgi:hypothetical protein